MTKNTKYTLTQYVTDHHPQVLEQYNAFKEKLRKKKARAYMRSYYKPTGKKPGRPRIEDEE